MLINKLYIYDIRGNIALILIKSYLSEHFQFVRYNTTDSNYNYIKYGVHHILQGSELCQLLFILYNNDSEYIR